MMKFTFTMFVWKVMFSISIWKFVPTVCEKLEESSPGWNFTDISEQSSSPKPVSEPVVTLGFSLPQIIYSCEHSELHISCKEDRVIHIIQANYGRLTGNLCNEDGQVKWSGKRCVAHRTYDVLVDRCDQKQSCYVLASNTVFGDPCYGTIKYLQVQYNCVSHRTTEKPAISSTSIPTDLDYKSDFITSSTVHESFDDTMEEDEIENAKDAPLPDLDETLPE